MFNREDFRKGKVITTIGGGNSYQPRNIQILNCDFVYGNELEEPTTSDKLYFVFTLSIEGIEEDVVVKQLVFIDEETGELNNPIRPSYETKEGEIKPATLSYDIWQAIKDFHRANNMLEELEGLENMKGLAKERFMNKEFVMGVKVVSSKSNGKKYYVLDTSYQREKDRLYKIQAEASKRAVESLLDEEAEENSDVPF